MANKKKISSHHSLRKRISAHNVHNFSGVSSAAKLAASVFATGSGSAMLGSLFGPVGAVVGGIVGSTAAYLVETKNED